MTKFRSSFALLSILLTGCATSSGVPAASIAQPEVAAAYLPLQGRVHLGIDRAVGAAVVIAPGIAVTNAHNANLVDPDTVIGTATLSDLMFFRTDRQAVPASADPVVGAPVTAYGQGIDGDLRLAHGVVRERVMIAGYAAPAWFTFAGNAGPGFSGGPVIDAAGRLVGITFGYTDKSGKRLILAYDMTRVRAEFSALSKAQKSQ
jgi:S1-C subfamily serine protease